MPFDVSADRSARASGVWMKKPLATPALKPKPVTMLSSVRTIWPARGDAAPLPWISQISFGVFTLTVKLQDLVWGTASSFEAVIRTT